MLSTGAPARQAGVDGGSGVLVLPAVRCGASSFTDAAPGLVGIPAERTGQQKSRACGCPAHAELLSR